MSEVENTDGWQPQAQLGDGLLSSFRLKARLCRAEAVESISNSFAEGESKN